MMSLAQPNQKVVVGSIVDDWMVIFLLKGAGGEHLRNIYLEIWCQKFFNDKDMDKTNGFEFKLCYKCSIPLNIRTLFFLRVGLEVLHSNLL